MVRTTLGGHPAVPGIQTHHDPVREGLAGLPHKPGVLHCLGADDHITHSHIEVGADGCQIPDAAANLQGQIGPGRGNAPDDITTDRPTGKGAVQIHQVETAGTLVTPVPRHAHRIIGEDRAVIHAALSQSHTLATLEIDCRNYDQ